MVPEVLQELLCAADRPPLLPVRKRINEGSVAPENDVVAATAFEQQSREQREKSNMRPVCGSTVVINGIRREKALAV